MWDVYMAAYEEILNRCTTAWAPWHVVLADQKWYRNLAVPRTILDALERLAPQFPPADEGVGYIQIN